MLLTADIHLNSNPEDEMRWGLIPWIIKQCDSYGIKEVGILGDLTTAKDKHNAILVNRFAKQIKDLARYAQVDILKGNHDFITPETPFFEFLNQIINVKFIVTPYKLRSRGNVCHFLPATKHPEKWEELGFADCDYIFTHATFKGVVTETGFPLPGIDPNIFGDTDARILSGDIHMPVKIEGTNIEYVGAPYRTNYGDTFTPRVIYIDDEGRERDLHYPCPSKHLLEVSSLQDIQRTDLEIKKGDFVKIRVRLHRAEYPEWQKTKQEIIDYVQKQDWVLHGKPELTALVDNRPRLNPVNKIGYHSPKELISSYAKDQDFDDETTQFGLSLLEDL